MKISQNISLFLAVVLHISCTTIWHCDEGNCENGVGIRSSINIGTRYKGNFTKGQIKSGIIEYTNGSLYEGEIESNSWNGKGHYKSILGFEFDGNFRFGSPIGSGIITYRGKRFNVEEKRNDYCIGNCENGQGILFSFSHQKGSYIFECKFKNGKSEGKGKFIFSRHKNEKFNIQEGEFTKLKTLVIGTKQDHDGTLFTTKGNQGESSLIFPDGLNLENKWSVNFYNDSFLLKDIVVTSSKKVTNCPKDTFELESKCYSKKPIRLEYQNAIGYCFTKNMRLPTEKELKSLYSYNKKYPIEDGIYWHVDAYLEKKSLWSEIDAPFTLLGSYSIPEESQYVEFNGSSKSFSLASVLKTTCIANLVK